MKPTRQRGWRDAIRRNPAVSAWPFVIVILTQMVVGGFSAYTLSAIRAFVTSESLWSKGQHEAVYFLNLYLDTDNQKYFESFSRAIDVPLEYREGRQFLEMTPANPAAARAAFLRAGNPPEDLSSLIWMFQNFRGFPYLETAIARWKETDPFIIELKRIGDLKGIGTSGLATRPITDVVTRRDHLAEIDAEITPRAIAFSRALNEGARVVEWILMVVNLALAAALAGLTIWRVSKVLTQRREIESELAWQASHDELTGLLNRRAFEQALLQALNCTKGNGAAGCTLMFMDLDQFKIVNDTCGHAAGDALLRRICPALLNALGPNDILARLGGDEFGILLAKTDMASALVIAERVRAAIVKAGFMWEGRAFGVTASIGLVQNEAGSLSPEEMMRAADLACYMAKEKGRNRVHAHHVADRELLGRVSEMNWVQRIHQALNEDRFCLYAQEIVPLCDGDNRGVHLEILIRMRDDTGTLIPPSSFLPAAERFGLVRLIDRWVVRGVFKTLADRLASGNGTPIICCAINLSGATIGDDAFLDFLEKAFAEFRIPPTMICFEVTETSAIINLDAARAFVQHLRGLGCTFALDDFGSGMSSFSYLKELPVDFLKIDGAFVKNLLSDRADRAMVEMINHVGHVMGKRIVAEFVETDALADALRDIGVDFGQGYGIARPKPFDAHFEGVAKVMVPIHDRFERRIA